MNYKTGNLLDMAENGEFDIIIHGCNCFNTMGGGIAKQIKNRYPFAYLTDSLTRKGDIHKLGKYTGCYIDRFNLTIINAYTQYDYGRDKPHVDYEAINNVFYQIKLAYDISPIGYPSIGIPQIGAGLAGGDWETIEKIIDRIGFNDLTCVLYE